MIAIITYVALYLLVGVLLARLWAVVQTDHTMREYESSPGRVGFNVLVWPFPALALIATGVGWLAMRGIKPKRQDGSR